jgi:hypothetical protein
MILRRLADAVQEQNWFTVLVELFLIVAGVFLGIQVSNWNEARLDRQLEDQFLERLVVDFRAIESDSLRRLARYVREIDDLRSLVPQLNEIGEDPDLGLVIPKLGALQNPFPEGGSATYQELVSTGRLGIIRSNPLREALSEFAARHETVQSSDRLNWDIAINAGEDLLKVAGLAIGIQNATTERGILEAELNEQLRQERDWMLQLGIHLALKQVRHRNEQVYLALARDVLRELGQKAEGGAGPGIVGSSVN